LHITIAALQYTIHENCQLVTTHTTIQTATEHDKPCNPFNTTLNMVKLWQLRIFL